MSIRKIYQKTHYFNSTTNCTTDKQKTNQAQLTLKKSSPNKETN
jgi:hypothetical protein